MSSTTMHPPADRRCQIYGGSAELFRCRNDGTHWEKWGGCGCDGTNPQFCESDYYSWECDGNHVNTPEARSA